MKKLVRWVLSLLAAAIVAIAVVGVAVGSSTSYDQRKLAYVSRPGDPRPPAWTKPCERRNARYRVSYDLPCGRVEGVVIYRQGRDPDGDGDVHAVVQGGAHLVIVKSSARLGPDGGLPGTGRRLTRVGTVTKGRFGLPVLDIRRSSKAR